MNIKPKKILFLSLKIIGTMTLVFIAFIFSIVLLFLVFPEGEKHDTVFGVAFSKIQADRLGIDWREAFTAVLDDLEVRHFRLASYWSEIEPQKGEFYWDDLDWQINEVKKRNGKVILVLGRKQFRWPECFIPGWAADLPIEEQRIEVLNFIEKTITRYKDEPVVWAWQVENEPLFPFGECPERNSKFLDIEIAKTKELDNTRPVIITDSGEMSTWLKTASRSDVFGTTLYKIVENRLVPGFLNYDFIPVSFYKKKAAMMRGLFRDLKDVVIIELQAEPWGVLEVEPIEQQFKTVDFERFVKNITYAKDVGYSKTYLWGTEWWYWMKTQKDHPEFWEYVKELRRE